MHKWDHMIDCDLTKVQSKVWASNKVGWFYIYTRCITSIMATAWVLWNPIQVARWLCVRHTLWVIMGETKLWYTVGLTSGSNKPWTKTKLLFLWLHLNETKNSPSVSIPKIIHKNYSQRGHFPSFQHAETHLHSSFYTPRFPARSQLTQLDKAHIKQQAEKRFF